MNFNEECRSRVTKKSENVKDPKEEDVTVGWRKQQNKEHCILHSYHMVRWVACVPCIGEMGHEYRVLIKKAEVQRPPGRSTHDGESKMFLDSVMDLSQNRSSDSHLWIKFHKRNFERLKVHYMFWPIWPSDVKIFLMRKLVSSVVNVYTGPFDVLACWSSCVVFFPAVCFAACLVPEWFLHLMMAILAETYSELLHF
jgi:hypothetical protein